MINKRRRGRRKNNMMQEKSRKRGFTGRIIRDKRPDTKRVREAPGR